jgi:hypothetical protein
MKSRVFIILLLGGYFAIVRGQDSVPEELAMQFHNQLIAFPQEKIHVHTDKPYYIAGEKIWFRAYLADAANHIPSPASRYVYVELINPLDTIVNRVKIRQDEEDAYHGHLLIPEGAPEGDYTLRAYTTFMRSQDEHYFFSKNIRIGDPQARTIHAEADFTFTSNREKDMVNVSFRFSQPTPSDAFVSIHPKSVKVSVNDGKPMNIELDDDGTAAVHFNLPDDSRKRTILLEVVTSQNPYRKFFSIPTPDDDFDVTFYPEGGSRMMGIPCKTAFKAMKSNGQATYISGVIYDQNGTEITSIRSDHLGMGYFLFIAEKGKSYYAVCENDRRQTKRFELPSALEHGYALSVNNQMADKIHITILQPAESVQNKNLYLLAHTRGMVQFVRLWDHEKNKISLQRQQLPSGVLHLILFDAALNPVSERLVFINNPDQATVSYQPDKEMYASRSLISNRVSITDSEGQPLTGSFSVAVTSDREVTPDSTSNILTQLLLTSDLRGHIENPGFYFNNTSSSGYKYELDLLMLTQGWRRYNIAEVAKGQFAQPAWPIEVGSEILGVVKNVLSGKLAKDIDVHVMSSSKTYIDKTKTDKEGRFYFQVDEFPDSTGFLVNAVPKKEMTRLELTVDRETFPKIMLSAVTSAEIDRMQFARYADNAEQQYINERGIREYYLPEITVTAVRKPPRKSIWYDTPPASSFTEETIKRVSPMDIRDLINKVWLRTPGAFGEMVMDRKVKPLIVIDDMPIDAENIDMVNILEVEQIDFLRHGEALSAFGSRGAGGVIVIFTKKLEASEVVPPKHIKTFFPLGYQQPVEFYAPKYDTPTKRNAPTPDLRTTLHWQPVVQTDSLGVASFEFYTADEPTSYTVVIEGLTNDGKIIRQEGKTWRKKMTDDN